MGASSTELLYLAEVERTLHLQEFERLRRHGLLDLPPAPPLRSSLAAWLMRLALRLDARIGESPTFHPEPTHA